MTKENSVLNITDAEFEQAVGDGVSIVDFWAPWCYPCRVQGPILDKVAAKVGDNTRICKINVDENQETAGKYGVTGIPTLLLFKDGKVVKQFVGVQGEDLLVSTLESLA